MATWEHYRYCFFLCVTLFFRSRLVLSFKIFPIKFQYNPACSGLHFQKWELNNTSIMFKSCPILLFYFSDFRKKIMNWNWIWWKEAKSDDSLSEHCIILCIAKRLNQVKWSSMWLEVSNSVWAAATQAGRSYLQCYSKHVFDLVLLLSVPA